MSNLDGNFFDDCLSVARRWTAAACLLCGAGARDNGLCDGCFADLPHLPTTRCPICAVPGPGKDICGRCLSHPPAYDRVVAVSELAHPVDLLIQGLKYRGQLACARPLAVLLADALEAEDYPDLVLPMPLSNERLAERGFNQALEIGRLLIAEFGMAIDATACQRIRHTASQTSLPWERRAANVRNAYVCGREIRGKNIAVIDDVLTTGATLNELARTLKRQGAREVVGWIAARTPRPA